MAEWSFQRKLFTGVILIGVLAILTSVGTLLAARRLIESVTRVSSGEGRDLVEARALQLAGDRNIADVHACLLSGGKDFVSAARMGSHRVRELATQLRARVSDPAARTALDAVLIAERAHQDAYLHTLARVDTANGGTGELYPQPVLASGVGLDQALSAAVSYFEELRGRSVLPARAAVNRAQAVMLGINIATIALLVVLCGVLAGALSRSFIEQSTARARAERGQSAARASLTELETASHLKDEFLATVSHELRNPLAPILTWTQLLRSGTLDAEKSRRALEVIERNVQSQVQLIDDLVDVSRVVSGKFRLDVRPIDLIPIIRGVAEAHLPASDARQLRLQFVLDDRAGLISGDSERLQQVIANLLSNAIKFTPKGGTVQVVLQRADSQIEVSVIDTGIGIDPAFLPHVFEPFRQGSAGPMRRHSGLGLGLSIARHIMELHGGEIVAHSAGIGLGAKFTVSLPVLATTGELAGPARRHPVARDTLAELRLGRLEGLRILLVDDEPLANESLQALFESCGAEVKTSSSASQALSVFKHWTPEVLISDIAMPGEDGYSLIRKVRLLPAGRGGTVPAVALTAHAKIEDRITILSAGFQMYLAKPADPNELVAVVGSLTNKRGPGDSGA